MTSRAPGLLLLLAAWGTLAAGFYAFLPAGYDFYHWYQPVPLAWLEGRTQLYDEATRGFYSPPWAVWLLLPFALLGLRGGMAASTALSFAIVAGVSFAYAQESGARRPALLAFFATLCPYSLGSLLVGTPDPWALLGIFLSYRGALAGRPWLLGGGLLLASVRPQDLVLTGPALLLAARGWPPGLWGRAAVLPLLAMATSMAAFGPAWPFRWAQNYLAASPTGFVGGEQPVTSTYVATGMAGVPLPLVVLGAGCLAGFVLFRVWRRGLSPGTLDPALAANAIVSPHMLSHGYVILLALPWARLAVRRPLQAALLYAISLPLLFRAQGLWERLGLLDVTFPLLLMAVLLLERPPVEP